MDDMTKDGWIQLTDDEPKRHFITVARDRPIMMLRRHDHLWFKYVTPEEIECEIMSRSQASVDAVIMVE